MLILYSGRLQQFILASILSTSQPVPPHPINNIYNLDNFSLICVSSILISYKNYMNIDWLGRYFPVNLIISKLIMPPKNVITGILGVLKLKKVALDNSSLNLLSFNNSLYIPLLYSITWFSSNGI